MSQKGYWPDITHLLCINERVGFCFFFGGGVAACNYLVCFFLHLCCKNLPWSMLHPVLQISSILKTERCLTLFQASTSGLDPMEVFHPYSLMVSLPPTAAGWNALQNATPEKPPTNSIGGSWRSAAGRGCQWKMHLPSFPWKTLQASKPSLSILTSRGLLLSG